MARWPCVYGLLYALVLSEDYALLLGAIVLFAALAAVMLVTRKIDWYRLASSGVNAVKLRASRGRSRLTQSAVEALRLTRRGRDVGRMSDRTSAIHER